MTEAPRRKIWQWHLSTAIVMSFVAGGIVWANTVKHYGVEIWEGDRVHQYFYGWPLYYSKYVSDPPPGLSGYVQAPYWNYSYECFALDVAIGIGILLVTGFLIEFVLRRRAAS